MTDLSDCQEQPSGNSAATWRVSSSGTVGSRSPLNTSVGTNGYVACGGTAAEAAVGFCQKRQSLPNQLNGRPVAADFENGAK